MTLMSNGLRITLIVVTVIVGVWLLLLFVNLIFVASFSSIFKKHKRAVPVVLYSKYESLNSLVSIMKQSGINIDNRFVAILSDISSQDFSEPGSQQFEKVKNTLSYLRDELMFVANQHPELKDDFEFNQVKKNINDTDIQYRSTVAMYNADVLGYNYWISFLPCRFVFLMFRVKPKEIIS